MKTPVSLGKLPPREVLSKIKKTFLKSKHKKAKKVIEAKGVAKEKEGEEEVAAEIGEKEM